MSQLSLSTPLNVPEIKEYLASFGGKPILSDGTKLNGLPIDDLYARALAWKVINPDKIVQ